MFSKVSFTACTYFMNVSDFFLLTEKQLGLIMTAVLSIPMADELPTHNARKTCALAIWLIQVQRLPAEVLQPTASRIAYALRRGIDGELGKEGKKGSANDGMKVHIFTPLLSFHGLDFFFCSSRPFMTSVFTCLQFLSPLLLIFSHHFYPTSSLRPSHSEPRLVMPWVASFSDRPQYQYPPPTRESPIQSPPISPLSHPLPTPNPLQKPSTPLS